MPESWCDPHINQRRLCIPTSGALRRIGPFLEATLGHTAFTHQEPKPGGSVWIVEVDAESLAGSRETITQGVAVHA